MFCTYVRTPSPEIMNHFASLWFGLCFGVDQQVRRLKSDPPGPICCSAVFCDVRTDGQSYQLTLKVIIYTAEAWWVILSRREEAFNRGFVISFSVSSATTLHCTTRLWLKRNVAMWSMPSPTGACSSIASRSVSMYSSPSLLPWPFFRQFSQVWLTW